MFLLFMCRETEIHAMSIEFLFATIDWVTWQKHQDFIVDIRHDRMMEVISTRRYEVRPPTNTHSPILVSNFSPAL